MFVTIAGNAADMKWPASARPMPGCGMNLGLISSPSGGSTIRINLGQSSLLLHLPLALRSSFNFSLIILFALWCQISSKAADLLTGTVHYQMLKYPSTYTYDRLYNFSFQIEGEKWVARIEPIYSKTDHTNDVDLPDYEVAAFDGSTIYYIISFETITAHRIANTHAQNTNRITTAQASIFQGEMPWGVNPILADLWLVFGSKNYLRSKGEGVGTIPPFRFNYTYTNVADASQTVNAEWKVTESGAFTVERFVEFHKKDTSVANTNLVCSLTSTNSALVTVFWRSNEPLTVTEITLTNNQSGLMAMPFIPTVPKNTITQDFRCAMSNPPASFSYVITDNRWPNLDFANTLYSKKHFLKNNLLNPIKQQPGSRWFIWVLFAVITLPFMFLIWKQLSTNKNQ